jgi:cell division protease FtsH
MVRDWGMSEELGLVHYGNGAEERQMSPMFGQSEYSDNTADLLDKEIKAIVDRAYQSASAMIEENRDKVESLAQALLKYETLGADEVMRIFDGEVLDKPTVADLIGIEQAKTDSPGDETSPHQGDSPESSKDSPDA